MRTRSRLLLAMLLAMLVPASACDIGSRRTWVEPTTGMEFVYVAPGAFTMGSPASELGRGDDETPHRVRISRGFYLGTFEVTQAQWTRVMGENPSYHHACPQCPVERVSWFDARAFMAKLASYPGNGTLRLPTEAEWEYACRAGTTTPFAFGESLDKAQANYDTRYPYRLAASDDAHSEAPRPDSAQTVPVGRYPPNAWGLHDMHGNVWEWCEDEYCPYPADSVADPIGRCDSGRKVIRGGSWYFSATSARSARRFTHAPGDVGFSLGFRVVREVAPER